MITKQKRSEILEKIKDKEKRIIIANVLDKAICFEKNDKLQYTNYLDIHDIDSIVPLLKGADIKYMVYVPNNNCEKKNIFFIPSYIKNVEDVFAETITCIKIVPKQKEKLSHKDYMGSIYSLGIKREMIGDIFAYKNFAYVFLMRSVLDFVLINLTKVANQEVKIEELLVSVEEVKKLELNFLSSTVIVSSLRVDAVLSEVYNLSRNEAKDKIQSGALYINSKEEYYGSNQLKIGDIVSFKRYGKFKLTQMLRNTKSGNLVIEIQKYN